MELNKNIKIFTILILALPLFGCATTQTKLEHQEDSLYKQGYQEGVSENINEIIENLNGNDFPYYNWSKPIVQEVRIPARIINGVMVPEHNELVVIKPGEWKKTQGYPIVGARKEKLNEDEIKDSNMGPDNITSLPAKHTGEGKYRTE